MCGLVGVAGDINNKFEKLFKVLLQIDVIRGADSTGVAFVNNSNVSSVHKETGPPQFLWGYEETWCCFCD